MIEALLQLVFKWISCRLLNPTACTAHDTTKQLIVGLAARGGVGNEKINLFRLACNLGCIKSVDGLVLNPGISSGK